MARKQDNVLLPFHLAVRIRLLGTHTTSNSIICQDNDIANSQVIPWPTHHQQSAAQLKPQDHFVTRDGVEFAGTHLILDFWDASCLDDIGRMEQALREGIKAAKATLLHIHLHHFTPYQGISGVAVLAESHISVHTWPERNFAAFDIFMCGNADPDKTVPVLKRAFRPGRCIITRHLRGEVVAG